MTSLSTPLTYKGTRIVVGNDKRAGINKAVELLIAEGFDEISMPVIQFQSTFAGKVGEENNNLMFNFKDRGERDLCLAPEYTAVIQKIAHLFGKDKKLFYVQECFRCEKPQAGRYRQFTQLGVEVLNPTRDYTELLIDMAIRIIRCFTDVEIAVSEQVTRGLDYYKEGKGFEIRSGSLQLCGGGTYDGGQGFAVGVDRVV